MSYTIKQKPTDESIVEVINKVENAQAVYIATCANAPVNDEQALLTIAYGSLENAWLALRSILDKRGVSLDFEEVSVEN